MEHSLEVRMAALPIGGLRAAMKYLSDRYADLYGEVNSIRATVIAVALNSHSNLHRVIAMEAGLPDEGSVSDDDVSNAIAFGEAWAHKAAAKRDHMRTHLPECYELLMTLIEDSIDVKHSKSPAYAHHPAGQRPAGHAPLRMAA